MVKKSLLSRLAGALREKEGPTSKDIDHEVESAVQAIEGAEVETLKAEDVLDGGWGEAGDRVHIIDLKLFFEVIGGRTGRLSDALKDICVAEFSKQISLGSGRASFKGDYFYMRFFNVDESKGFRLAASIVNEVGTRILRDRFRTLEIPGLLVVADAADITNKDGSLNLDRTSAVVQGGGLPTAMDKPDADAPGWVQLRWKIGSGGGLASLDVAGANVAPGPSDPAWIEGSNPISAKSEQQTRDTSGWKQRKSDRRRRKSAVLIGSERRKNWRVRRSTDSSKQMVW